MQGPAEIVVPVQAESIKVVRDWVGEVLARLGQDTYLAKIVVSELLTNVLRHTASATATVRVVQADRGRSWRSSTPATCSRSRRRRTC